MNLISSINNKKKRIVSTGIIPEIIFMPVYFVQRVRLSMAVLRR